MICKIDPNICEVWWHRNTMKIKKCGLTKKKLIAYFVKNINKNLFFGFKSFQKYKCLFSEIFLSVS